MQMKAIVLDGLGEQARFRKTTLPVPVPGDHELLIRIKAAAFNPIDYQMRQGRRESRLMRSPVLGRELSGIVEAIGREVKGFAPGDPVIAAAGSMGSNGTYAEMITIPCEIAAHAPAGLPFPVAAGIPTAGLTAWQAFQRMAVKPEEAVFISGGAGAVGSFMIRLLRANDIDRIVTTAGNEHSRQALRDMGLEDEQIIDYTQEDTEQRILAANGHTAFDWAVDTVGGKMAEAAAGGLRPQGGYVDITFLATPLTRERLFDKGCHVLNISNYTYALAQDLSWYGRALKEVATLITNGKIAPPEVNIIGPLETATVEEAHRLLETGQTRGRKLVMEIRD